MATSRDKRRLIKALREVGALEWQIRGAAMLLAANGIDNALGYIYALRDHGLLSQQPQQSELELA